MSAVFKALVLLTLSLNFAFAQDPKADAFKSWEKRDEKAGLTDAIKKFEILNKANPADTEVLLFLMRSHFLMGDSFMNSKDEKMAEFEKAFTYGDTALATNTEYAARLKKGDDIEDAVKALTMNEVAQMYWTAGSIGKYARQKGIFASLKYKSKILALITRVEQLKPDYFYGAVDRYWGSYFAVIPGIAGKDLKKSKKHFDKSLKMGPEYVGTKVLLAETYYVEKDDEKGFKKILNEVLTETAYDVHPELGPENRLEKIKAKKLLEQTEDLF